MIFEKMYRASHLSRKKKYHATTAKAHIRFVYVCLCPAATQEKEKISSMDNKNRNYHPSLPPPAELLMAPKNIWLFNSRNIHR